MMGLAFDCDVQRVGSGRALSVTGRKVNDRLANRSTAPEGGWVVGKVTNAAVQAKQRARERRLLLETDRQAQEDRIDEATAAVIVAVEEIDTAQSARAAVIAAAQAVFDAAVTAADDTAAAVVSGAESRIGASLRELAAEKLPGSRIAELTELSAVDVRRLSKDAAAAAGPAAKDAAGEAGPAASNGEGSHGRAAAAPVAAVG